MKLSLKFTVIALLLSGVFIIQNLDAASAPFFEPSGKLATRRAVKPAPLTDVSLAAPTGSRLVAFSESGVPSAVVPVSTGWTEYLGVKHVDSILPVAEQIYLLTIRANLASPAGLVTSLGHLDTLLKTAQKMAIDDRSGVDRASFLVAAIPQIRGIAPVIGGYLQSILGQIAEIDAAAHHIAAGWLVPATIEYNPLQKLQRDELLARKNLAYAVFDAVFGRMVKPAIIPAAGLFTTEYKAANKLTAELHVALPVTLASQTLAVKKDGSIPFVDGADFSTGLDLSLPFMAGVCKETSDFQAMALGAAKLVGTACGPDSLKGFGPIGGVKAWLNPAIPGAAAE